MILKIFEEKGILLKSYEKESLLKNFFVFFSLLTLLLIVLFIELYHTQKKDYMQNVYKNMQVCSLTLKCEEYDIDFSSKNTKHLHELYHGSNKLKAYFPILNSEKFDLELSYPEAMYLKDLSHIQSTLFIKFFLALLLLSILSLFFTFYSLKPIRKALKLNDEFIKDILHDFNTPISSMLLNINMFEEDKGKNIFLNRISTSIDNIVMLQNNLKCFLQHSPTQSNTVNISSIIIKRIEFMQTLYPKIDFSYEKKNNLFCVANDEILIRIFDNILSNAAKYNKPHGKVHVSIDGNTITIKDTGKGIEDVSKVFQRYYKEQERGLGLGLHIVKKLVDALNIEIEIVSNINSGTTFSLDFKHLLGQADGKYK